MYCRKETCFTWSVSLKMTFCVFISTKNRPDQKTNEISARISALVQKKEVELNNPQLCSDIGQCRIAAHSPGTGTVSNVLCGPQNSKTYILNFDLPTLNSIFLGLI